MGTAATRRGGRMAMARTPAPVEDRSKRAMPRRDAGGRFLPAGTHVVIEKEGRGAAPVRKTGEMKAAGTRWSARRQAIFLANLAETANVTGSARAAKISPTTVRRKRRDCADFRAQWERALGEGVAKLKMQLLDRALNGVRETVWHGGKKVGTVLKFNDRMALALIAAHDVKGDPIESAPPIPEEALRERLKAKLGEMNRRMGGAG